MNILGVESSAQSAGAAVISDGKLIGEYFLNNGLTHSQTLMVLIDGVLKSSGMTAGDIDLFAVDEGPGSFTGLRIGVGTVKGLAAGVDKPVAGVSSLEALAYNVPFFDGIISPILDARRSQVYNSLYKWESGVLRQLAPKRAIAMEDLLKELKGGALFLGDGVLPNREIITRALGDSARFAPEHLMYQRASSVAAAALNAQRVSPRELVPYYIRRSQAERDAE